MYVCSGHPTTETPTFLKGTIHVAAHAFFLNDGRRVYLVDTPGFDDGKRPEAEILKEVSNFFAAT